EHGHQAVADNDDVGGFDGDVGATAHRHANIRLHQGRGVVDAVADHGDASSPLCLQLAHDLGLLPWQDARTHVVNTDFASHVCSGTLVVSRHQDRGDASMPHGGDGFGSVRSHLIP